MIIQIWLEKEMKNIEVNLVSILVLLGLAVAVYASTPIKVAEPAYSTERYEMAEPFSSGALVSYSSLEASPNES